VVEFLVYHQFVHGRHHDDPGSYRVVKGSGMGLLHSGDLADLCYDFLVDEWIMRVSTTRAFGIKAYCRFKDDSIVIMPGDKIDAFMNIVNHRSKFFEVTVDEITEYFAVFLNLLVCKAGTQLTIKHYTKPTATSIPLSSLSAQAPSIHRSWPASMCKTIDRLSTREADARKAKVQLWERYSCSTVPLIKPSESVGEKKTIKRDRTGTLWLTLPYHPASSMALAQSLGEIQNDTKACFFRGVSAYLDGAVNVAIAWSNVQKPINVRLKTLSRAVGRG